MAYKIYFCNDNVLRLGLDNLTILPMNFIQKQEELNNFQFWLKWWNESVVFEKGLTIGNFLNCLEPWTDFFSPLTNVDINSFIQESKNSLNGSDNTIDWILLGNIIEINEDVTHEDKKENIDLLQYLKEPKKIKIESEWLIEQSYHLTGYKLGDNTSSLIRYKNLGSLKNTPLVLNQSQIIKFSDLYNTQINGESFNNKSSLISYNHHDQSHFLLGQQEQTFRSVVEGFFKNLFKNPQQRDTAIAQLSIQEQLVTQPKQSLKSNKKLLKVFDNGIEKHILINKSNYNKHIEPSHNYNYNSNKKTWLKFLNQAKKDSTIQFKIGFRESSLLEQRVDNILMYNNKEDDIKNLELKTLSEKK